MGIIDQVNILNDGKFGLNAIQNVLIIGIRNKKFEEK